MKKLVLFSILLITSTSAFSEAIVPEIPTSDIEGGKDHPLLKRYTDSYLVVHQQKGFEEFTFPMSKLTPHKNPVGNIYDWSIDQSKTIEGPYTRLVYLLPVNRSPLEVLRNYQEEIVALGGNVLYECRREECGGDHERGIGKAHGVTSLAMILRSRERLGVKDYSQGFCATIGNIMDQRYFVSELPDTETYISVHTYNIKGFGYTNCNAFIGRSVAVVDIVEGKPREKNMVTVEASEMARQISATGSVSLYGIFFDSNSSTVRENSETTLQEIAKLLQQQPDLELLVVGHTDNAGTFKYNTDLSQKRAQSVVDELSTKHGVSPERLVPFGVSYASPVSTNATAKGQALNRRVELVENRTQ